MYGKIKEIPMDSPISGFLAEAVMPALVNIIREARQIFLPHVWMIASSLLNARILKRRADQSAAYSRSLNLTCSGGDDGKLAFLGVLVKRNASATMETEAFRKQARDHQILNSQIKSQTSCMRTFFMRVKLVAAREN